MKHKNGRRDLLTRLIIFRIVEEVQGCVPRDSTVCNVVTQLPCFDHGVYREK